MYGELKKKRNPIRKDSCITWFCIVPKTISVLQNIFVYLFFEFIFSTTFFSILVILYLCNIISVVIFFIFDDES